MITAAQRVEKFLGGSKPMVRTRVVMDGEILELTASDLRVLIEQARVLYIVAPLVANILEASDG